MVTILYALVVPFLVVFAIIFLIYRFGFFSKEPVAGRFSFLSGSILLIIASLWQSIKDLTAYSEWFVESAYPILDLLQLFLFLGGIILVAVGLALYADFWQNKKDELINRDQQLSLLNNLQRDAREPYQLLELLEISLKEIITHLPQTAGVIFFVNRTNRQLVLTTAVGLSKQETAKLERYPLGRNIITQSIELGDPMISGSFEFVSNSGEKSDSRFNSCLILPMVSNMEKIGGVVLLSEKRKFFSRNEVKYLAPVVEWLSEKIKTARLNRELNVLKGKSQKHFEIQEDLNKRIVAVSNSFSSKDIIESLCRSMVGLVSCQSVHLLGLKNGALHFYGGSEPLFDLSENYKTALIDALDREKPLIINQEAVNNEGRSGVVSSTLVYSLKSSFTRDALIFVKESIPFKVGDDDLKIIDIFAKLTLVGLKYNDIRRLDFTSHKGLEKILTLLRFDKKISFENEPGFFIKHLSNLFPAESKGIMFVKQDDNSYKAIYGFHTRGDDLTSMKVLPGEGIIGKVTESYKEQIVFEKNEVAQELLSFDESNRSIMYHIFGEQSIPNFLGAYPITEVEHILGVAVIVLFDISENEKEQWHRLLTLTAGLYSIRLTISKLSERQPQPEEETAKAEFWGDAVNQLNNYLSAIIGNAELITMSSSVSNEINSQFQNIIREAENAANYLRDSWGKYTSFVEKSNKVISQKKHLNEIINEILNKSRISENLFMVGGRPREINCFYEDTDRIDFADYSIKNFFEEALNRFASLADEDDIITISTYIQDGYVFLDISRHHKNFPPVEHVSSFGDYQRPSEVLKFRPVDTFLNHVDNETCYYSFDRLSLEPSYLSFKFPIKTKQKAFSLEKTAPKILAIDDQEIILDLISAMCQSSGYHIKTANSGEKGLRLALNEPFDIIFTDLAMPGLSGLELAREIRKKNLHLPIVLVTGWGMHFDENQLKNAGITKILYKPFRIEQLTDIITSLSKSRLFS